MRPLVASSIILLIVFGLLGGCGPRAPVIRERPAFVRQSQWIAALEARTKAWSSYQVQLHLKGQSSKGKFSLRVVILADLPDRCRIEAFNPLGQTVSVLIVNRGQQLSNLFVPPENTIYSAQKPETLVAHFLGLPLPLEVFGYSLVAAMPPRHLETLELTAGSAGWTGRSRDTDLGWTFSYHLQDPPPALASMKVNQGARDYSISYAPPAALDISTAPEKISFLSSQWGMEVTLHQARYSPELPESAFTDRFPPTARRIDLDHSP